METTTIRIGDIVTSNGKNHALVTYVSETADYVELRYGDGFAFRRRLSDVRPVYPTHIPHAASQTVTTCPGCQYEAEQRRRWAALDAVPCSHTIPGTCDYC
jgi:hypothetical protein